MQRFSVLIKTILALLVCIITIKILYYKKEVSLVHQDESALHPSVFTTALIQSADLGWVW